VCAGYLLVTIYQIWFETVALINRIENATEFFCDWAAAVILSFDIFSDRYILITCVFAFRGGAYIILRRTILRDFKDIEYIKIFSTLL
jgi:hypothetical protein